MNFIEKTTCNKDQSKRKLPSISMAQHKNKIDFLGISTHKQYGANKNKSHRKFFYNLNY